jgi:hypothetical protein
MAYYIIITKHMCQGCAQSEHKTQSIHRIKTKTSPVLLTTTFDNNIPTTLSLIKMPQIKAGSSSSSTAARLASMAIGQSQGVEGRYVEPTSHPMDKAIYEDELTDMMDTGITMDSDDEEEEGQSNLLPPNLPVKRFVSLCVLGSIDFLTYPQTQEKAKVIKVTERNMISLEDMKIMLVSLYLFIYLQ